MLASKVALGSVIVASLDDLASAVKDRFDNLILDEDGRGLTYCRGSRHLLEAGKDDLGQKMTQLMSTIRMVGLSTERGLDGGGAEERKE